MDNLRSNEPTPHLKITGLGTVVISTPLGDVRFMRASVPLASLFHCAELDFKKNGTPIPEGLSNEPRPMWITYAFLNINGKEVSTFLGTLDENQSTRPMPPEDPATLWALLEDLGKVVTCELRGTPADKPHRLVEEVVAEYEKNKGRRKIDFFEQVCASSENA